MLFGQTEAIDEIKKSLIISMQRVQMELPELDLTCLDIFNTFKNVSVREIREALKKGSTGAYGSTYRMSTQEVCIWIRKLIVFHLYLI